KFVITLDADTELPIDGAKRLIGTLAHPLNRPVLDEQGQRVRDGYAIIQPRTAITAVAAGQSRFTQILAGDSGLDPYSTAASDVYQDLLEGAYARAGLATDIQLLEDYPSGVDAYMQRQHRWIRGDWQITDWLFPWISNPLPLIERWKILDNLRRSLSPASIVALLLA